MVQASVAELQPLHTLWGHGGRLWDCCFGGGAWAGGCDAGIGGSGDSGANSGNSSGSGGGSGSSLGSGSWTGGLGSFLVTASEDCTCRVWCLATGRQLAVLEVRVACWVDGGRTAASLQCLQCRMCCGGCFSLAYFHQALLDAQLWLSLFPRPQGHRGRGPWSCALLPRPAPGQPAAVLPPLVAHAAGEELQVAAAATAQEAASAAAAAGCYLLTGGADASIKCWTLADWLPSPAAAACPASAAGAELCTLQGLPPCPEATAVGQCRSYEPPAAQHSVQQTQQDAGALQKQQQEQQADAGAVTARDSRTEWARCLALASNVRWSSGDGGSNSCCSGSQQPRRRRQLYVATNRGLVHRVQLPGKLQKNAMLAVAGCCQDYTSMCGVHTTEGTTALLCSLHPRCTCQNLFSNRLAPFHFLFMQMPVKGCPSAGSAYTRRALLVAMHGRTWRFACCPSQHAQQGSRAAIAAAAAVQIAAAACGWRSAI